MTSSLPQRLAAEALGVFFLVAVGCGAATVAAQTGAFGHVGVALAFGLVVFTMVASIGHVSGAHINPAVTVAFALIRHFPWREVPLYVTAQCLGATAGAAVLRALHGLDGGLGVTVPAGTAAQSLGMELVLTAILMFVITAVATDVRAVGEMAALAIGATVALDALWGGQVSGASMNPARSLGPAILTGTWDAHWLYWLGPILGAVLGAGAYQALKAPRAMTDPPAAGESGETTAA